DPNLNATTRTARARVVIDNADRHVMHRQTGTAVVHIESPETLLVPRSAVLQHTGKPVVFVEQKERTYAAREITLGRMGDKFAEVTAGLDAGDRVVTHGPLILDGQAQLAHAATGHAHHSSQDRDGQPARPPLATQKIAVGEAAHDGDAYN